MTAPTDRDVHPDVVEISDLTEELLAPERASEVRAHVESCALCGEVLASLQEIQGLLGDQPPAEPMPVDVAARIDAALAAEASDPSDPSQRSLPTGPSHVSRETRPPAPRHPAADVSRGTSVPSRRPSAPTGPGRGGRRMRGLRIAAASSTAVLALGWLTYQLAQHSGPGGTNADSAVAKKGDGQAAGTSDPVAAQVAELLLDHPATSGKTGGANSPLLTPKHGTTVTAPNGTVAVVPVCVLKATRRSQAPLAAEREPYQGVDSYLVVLPDPADVALVDAFVVNASCTGTTPGSVLFQSSYPRG